MNKKREKRIDECRAILEGILEEEQEYSDAMPESLQESERGQLSQQWLEALEEAIAALEVT